MLRACWRPVAAARRSRSSACRCRRRCGARSADQAWRSALSGGEDYELCFTAAQAQRGALAALAERTGQAVTRIGALHAGTGLTLQAAGAVMQFSPSGFDHFGN